MQRFIGRSGRTLKPVGLGCMGLSGVYNAPVDPRAATELLHEAIELGVEHFDTAEVYGLTQNEDLLGAAFCDRREKVYIATKWGPKFNIETGERLGVDGSAANCRRAIEGSLKRLKTDHVDLYYLHRVDPKTPIEESVGAMAELVREGKVRGIGLSEASADTIRRAAKVAPITAVQSEYSIFTRDVEAGPLAAIEGVGASLVAFSPVGRGLLTGAMKPEARPRESDFRTATIPRFSKDNFAANLDLTSEIKAVANENNAHPAQVALAWLLGRSPAVHIIPGTTQLSNLRINVGAPTLVLSPGQVSRLDALADKVAGARYTPDAMSQVNR